MHQTKYYAVAEIDIVDAGWIPDYVQEVTRLVEQHGGRYLARTADIEKVEGERKAPGIFLIIEWPSRNAAMTFYESDAYRPYRESRWRGAQSEFALVTGEDAGKTARMA